jgi:hypothetical protein
MLQFIVREPYPGYPDNILSSTLDFPAYKAARPELTLRVVDKAQLDDLEAEYLAGRVTEPTEITQERFWEALECLPPSRYQRNSGVEVFHICERITGNLVSWYGHKDDRYFTFDDLDNRPAVEIANKFKGAMA